MELRCFPIALNCSRKPVNIKIVGYKLLHGVEVVYCFFLQQSKIILFDLPTSHHPYGGANWLIHSQSDKYRYYIWSHMSNLSFIILLIISLFLTKVLNEK